MFLLKRFATVFALAILISFTGFNNSYSNSLPDIPVFVQEFSGQVDFVEGRLTQLAEAVPEEDYGWRPEEGVRSVGEVYLHTAFGNYLWITVSGGKVPEDVHFVPDPSKIGEWDTQTTDKKEIMAIMKKSFDVLREFAKSLTAEDLEKEVEFFNMKFSLRNFLISGLNHLHEHLGQSIAYARTNHVVPPWSQKQDSN